MARGEAEIRRAAQREMGDGEKSVDTQDVAVYT